MVVMIRSRKFDEDIVEVKWWGYVSGMMEVFEQPTTLIFCGRMCLLRSWANSCAVLAEGQIPYSPQLLT